MESASISLTTLLAFAQPALAQDLVQVTADKHVRAETDFR